MAAGTASRSQLVLVAAQVLRLALALALLGALGRVLSPAQFGPVVLVGTLFIVANELMDLGTAAVTTRQVAAQPAQEGPLLSRLLAWRRWVALLLCVAWGTGLLAWAAAGRALPPWPVALAVAAGLALLPWSSYHVVFQVRQAFGASAAMGLAVQGLVLGAALALVAGPAAGPLAVLLMVAREAGLLVSSRLVGRRLLAAPLQPRWRDPALPRLLREALAVGGAALLYKLCFHGGLFWLWLLGPASELGHFGAAHRLAAPALDVAMLFAAPLLPWLVAASAAGQMQVLGAYGAFVLGAGLLLAVAGWACAPALLGALYGPGWAGGNGVAALRGLVVALACAALNQVLAMALLARHDERALVLGTAVALMVMCAGNLWWTGSHGAPGAAWALALAEVALLAWLLLRSRWRPAWRDLATALPALLPALLLALALALLAGRPAWQLGLAAVAAPLLLAWLWQRPAMRACRRMAA